MEKQIKDQPSKLERLQVVLARFGLASRRGVVSMIEDGQVMVNDVIVLEKGFRVDATKDKITVGGNDISQGILHEKRYFIFNKPKGVMTTLQDPHAEKIVGDFFTDIPVRLFPVGRLDRDTTGLLIMTNDGELAFRLTHPKFGVKKKYRALIKGFLTDEIIKKIERGGIQLEEGATAPCQIQVDERSMNQTQVFVVLHEGKKRQIRRVFQKMGCFVKELERLSYGPLSLETLRYGQKRELSKKEVDSLYKVAGL